MIPSFVDPSLLRIWHNLAQIALYLYSITRPAMRLGTVNARGRSEEDIVVERAASMDPIVCLLAREPFKASPSGSWGSVRFPMAGQANPVQPKQGTAVKRHPPRPLGTYNCSATFSVC
ncbi:hypothetical protein SCLCIDRAFT_1013925 [Scleroderma citrinum Foug A]|uniref:Uncharacterized protein n=1 Tax=Scleroderma citrinum Foug A TaxID=1036808 RepID=A0A0C3A3L8_9AGAM|nr:hypothetical protein SCLCIDRAFT_1013925 [Scleroderma citrinum Foug A]